MQARWALTGGLALALAAGGHILVTKAATPSIAVEDLGPSGLPTYARAVSASGRAVGFGYDAGTVGFGFEHSGAPAFVPLPSGASELYAYAVNGTDVVTGSYRGADGISRAFRYDATTAVLTDVPLVSGATAATAQGINDGGVVVGFTFTPSGTRAFRHRPGLEPENLGDLGGNYSAAFAANASGIVVGESRDARGAFHAFRFNGTLHPLSPIAGSFSRGAAINGAGIIVGYSSTATGPLHAARWRSDTVVDDLGTLGGPTSSALGINARGDIVGRADVAPSQPHAFLVQDDQLIDLNSLIDEHSGWLLQAAYGINDDGVVVGEGLLKGAPRAFRLTLPSAEDADVTAPIVSAVSATPGTLWPPKHQLVAVTVQVSASDDSGETPACRLASVTSSDPDNGAGDGDTSGDIVITGAFSAKLRAERSGGRERIYTLAVQCQDGAGNVGTNTTQVMVPKNGN
jgi:probable HAF family extracellular repeat protein